MVEGGLAVRGARRRPEPVHVRGAGPRIGGGDRGRGTPKRDHDKVWTAAELDRLTPDERHCVIDEGVKEFQQPVCWWSPAASPVYHLLVADGSIDLIGVEVDL